MNDMIHYFLNRATESEIYNHLSACDPEFVLVLSERVDIREYSGKIHNKSERFEAWDGDVLVGLVAVYCNDQARHMAYITSVSVLGGWKGKGIAAELIRRCIGHAENSGMHCIRLEVAPGNDPAIKLYEKYGFVIYDTTASSITMKLFLGMGEDNAK